MGPRETNEKGNGKMTINESQQRVDERIKDELVQKETRVHHLANEAMRMRWTEEAPQLLETFALEMRSLAYQIRNLKAARLALRNA